MKVVIDANIIFAALLKDSITRKLLISLQVDFYFPEPLLEEIQKYKELIKKKAGYSESDFRRNFTIILEYVTLVSFSEMQPFIVQAKKIMGPIDPKDTLILAAALAHEGAIIWSTDAHLHIQKTVKAVRIPELLEKYKKQFR